MNWKGEDNYAEDACDERAFFYAFDEEISGDCSVQ